MFCSSCGSTFTHGLSYCSQCGNKVSLEKGDSTVEKTNRLRAETFIMSAMVGLFIFGLLTIAVLVKTLKTVLDLDSWIILGILMMSFFIMLLVEGVLFWRLLRLTRSAVLTEEPGEAAAVLLSEKQTTNELEMPQIKTLPATDNVPSVTEYTTREFAPIYRERVDPASK